MKSNPCSIEGCHRSSSGSICSTHRQRMKNTGTYDPPNFSQCSITTCARTAFTYLHGGVCQVHNHRITKMGGDLGAAWSPGAINDRGYRNVTSTGHILGQSQSEHRLVLFGVIGFGPHRCTYCHAHINWKSGLEVDHIDFDRLNNVPANLVQSCHKCNSDRSPKGRFTTEHQRSKGPRNRNRTQDAQETAA